MCFPYAGGNAVNFQPMARALRGSGLAVYAVELPGHDVAADSEPFAPMAQVVEQVVAEITGRGLTRVLLWGHSAGTAFAVETARQLQERGVDVQRMFLGAQLLGRAGGAARRHQGADRAQQCRDRRGAERRQRLHRARRAGRTACRARRRRLPARLRVRTPLFRRRPGHAAGGEAVRAGHGRRCRRRPEHAEFPRRHRDWQLLAEHVDLHELADGGHYFLRTRPTEAARPCCAPPTVLASSSIRNRKEMRCPPHPCRHCSTWTCNPVNLRCCGPRPPATRRAGRPSTGTRCAPPSPSTVRSWSAASGCATRPRSVPSFSGWPPV